jgi:DNA-binding MarR family transcriptional regulator
MEREPTRACLTPRQHVAWRTYLDGTRLLFAALESRLQADAGMPLAYLDILVTLSEAPDRTLRMGVLAARVRASSSKLSHAVSRLEECGWVQRRPHPTDRRATFAALTDEGAAALARAAPDHVDAVRQHLLDRLTTEQVDQLTQLGRAMGDTAPATPAD